MRRIPPAEWIELHETAAIEGPVWVDHPHPALRDCHRCRLLLVDYAPFEDVIEIRLDHDGAEIRLLIDDPQEIHLLPGEAVVIRTRDGEVGVHQAPEGVASATELESSSASV
jgi:hypothetical protein